MNKRAQFFIIAALVVSSIIVGTSGIRNQAREEVIETATVDLSQELSYEAHQVLDNGVFSGKDKDVIQKEMEELVEAYGISNPDSDIEIVFGDPDQGLKQIAYDTSTGAPGSQVTNIGETGIVLQNQEKGTEQTEKKKKLKVKIKLPKEKGNKAPKERVVERELALSEGQNVYVIVKKKIRNDQTVVIQP
ncbi:hypothetical protein FJZ22_01310 [Candidatus Pacearchaeota archaeon]|nr:hypothetical protein [Candidatus Pacearchaeota archaeon]